LSRLPSFPTRRSSDLWRFGIRNVQRRPLHIARHIQDGWRLGVMEPAGNGVAVLRIENPLLTNRMTNAQNRSADHLSAQRLGMNRSEEHTSELQSPYEL